MSHTDQPFFMKTTDLYHPKGLYILFFTEMWERFSYYGMRALLVLYLVEGMRIEREAALETYATYTALVYLTPIVGGYMADRWLGRQRAVLTGGLVMAMGHFAMAFPDYLYQALGLLVVGNGFFKPNISTLVGNLYDADDPRRDGGFTIFYMGINLGALLSPLVCGTLGEKVGWHYGFAAAGIGMVIGVLVFAFGQRRLMADMRREQAAPFTVRDWLTVIGLSLGCLLLVITLVGGWPRLETFWHNLGIWGRGIIILTVLLPLLPGLRRRDPDAASQHQPLTLQDYRHILAIVILGIFTILFWMGFEQAGGTMNLFALENTDRNFFGWEIPASNFQSLNPLLILILAMPFSVLFTLTDRSRFALSTPTKMALGLIILGLGFVLLAIANERSEVVGRVSPLWLAGVYLLHTVGELFLSPIGLAMVTRLAPLQVASLMMGVWFTGVAIANYLAGTLESILMTRHIDLYWFLVTSSFTAGLALLMLTPLIKRLMDDSTSQRSKAR